MTLCEALQAAQNRGTVDSAIPARVKLSVGWYDITNNVISARA
jgi:hypothetical protein